MTDGIKKGTTKVWLIDNPYKKFRSNPIYPVFSSISTQTHIKADTWLFMASQVSFDKRKMFWTDEIGLVR